MGQSRNKSLAALDGEIHSLKTIQTMEIMVHALSLSTPVEGTVFHTLYGHLSIDSINDVKIGQSVKQGAKIAQLGDSSINGDYAPHLHFQIIKDLHGNSGDYPGVCSLNQLSFYKENCPNPMELLGMNKTTEQQF